MLRGVHGEFVQIAMIWCRRRYIGQSTHQLLLSLTHVAGPLRGVYEVSPSPFFHCRLVCISLLRLSCIIWEILNLEEITHNHLKPGRKDHAKSPEHVDRADGEAFWILSQATKDGRTGPRIYSPKLVTKT